MPLERVPGGGSLIDVLDRVLDKGILIDVPFGALLNGVFLASGASRVVVGSIDIGLRLFDSLTYPPFAYRRELPTLGNHFSSESALPNDDDDDGGNEGGGGGGTSGAPAMVYRTIEPRCWPPRSRRRTQREQ